MDNAISMSTCGCALHNGGTISKYNLTLTEKGRMDWLARRAALSEEYPAWELSIPCIRIEVSFRFLIDSINIMKGE